MRSNGSARPSSPRRRSLYTETTTSTAPLRYHSFIPSSSVLPTRSTSTSRTVMTKDTESPSRALTGRRTTVSPWSSPLTAASRLSKRRAMRLQGASISLSATITFPIRSSRLQSPCLIPSARTAIIPSTTSQGAELVSSLCRLIHSATGWPSRRWSRCWITL